MYCILNSQIIVQHDAAIGINDLSIMRGYGIFDFFRSYDNKPLFIDDHLERFFNSAKKVDLEIPYTLENLKVRILDLIGSNDLPEAGFRLILTGGYTNDAYSVGNPNLIVTQEKISFPEPLKYEEGVKLMSHEYLRDIPEVKTINYMTGIWLKSEIKKAGAFDVLYHNKGNLLELTRSNFFIIKGGRIITPKDQILLGITRKKLLEVASTEFIIEERPVPISELEDADEAFLTGTTKRILPVVKVDNLKIGNGIPGPVTKRLMQLFMTFELSQFNY